MILVNGIYHWISPNYYKNYCNDVINLRRWLHNYYINFCLPWMVLDWKYKQHYLYFIIIIYQAWNKVTAFLTATSLNLQCNGFIKHAPSLILSPIWIDNSECIITSFFMNLGRFVNENFFDNIKEYSKMFTFL